MCPWEKGGPQQEKAACSQQEVSGVKAKDQRAGEGGKTSGGAREVTTEKEVDYAALDLSSGNLGCGGWGGALMAEEREALLKLPRREYLLTKEEKKRALIGLIFCCQLILKLSFVNVKSPLHTCVHDTSPKAGAYRRLNLILPQYLALLCTRLIFFF